MIYFIEAVGADKVKIGFTDGDVEVRLKALQTGCRPSESIIHKQFAHLREHGEWFRLDPLLETYIEIHLHIQDLYRHLNRLGDLVNAVNRTVFPPGVGPNEDGSPRSDFEELRECIENDQICNGEDYRQLSSRISALESAAAAGVRAEAVRDRVGGDCRA